MGKLSVGSASVREWHKWVQYPSRAFCRRRVSVPTLWTSFLPFSPLRNSSSRGEMLVQTARKALAKPRGREAA